jgi:polysaccharide biosynthesis/export protein
LALFRRLPTLKAAISAVERAGAVPVPNRNQTLELSVIMKRALVFLALLLAVAAPAAAQNQTRERRAKESAPASTTEQTAARTRVVADQRDANHVRQPEIIPAPANTNKKAAPSWGDTVVASRETPRAPLRVTSNPANADGRSQNLTQPKLVKPPTLAVNSVAATREPVAPAASNVGNATSIYRVGIGDVLDIRLANMATRESTLFTVLKGGAIEYTLLEKPLPVAGLTPDEIARRLNNEVKVIQNARASVSVRDYASHSVVITGAVDNPGQKILRREAMPLFAILAEALPRAEATTATISRNGKETSVALANNEQMATLVMPGDAIKISAATKQFVYVGGAVASAGEKEFRAGMTLTQALLASGGALREASNKVKVVKRNRDGFLVPQEYDLHEINAGKAPDPALDPGDRIDVTPRF